MLPFFSYKIEITLHTYWTEQLSTTQELALDKEISCTYIGKPLYKNILKNIFCMLIHALLRSCGSGPLRCGSDPEFLLKDGSDPWIPIIRGMDPVLESRLTNGSGPWIPVVRRMDPALRLHFFSSLDENGGIFYTCKIPVIVIKLIFIKLKKSGEEFSEIK